MKQVEQEIREGITINILNFIRKYKNILKMCYNENR